MVSVAQLIVVGDSGLGKTTLVKALMSTPGERLQVTAGWGGDRITATGTLVLVACTLPFCD
jgi:GTPase SAR1 family protein